MLTEEDDVEIHALAARGWTKAAIARHTGRDRKTIRKYLDRAAGARGGSGHRAAWSRSAAMWRRGSSTIRMSTRRCCTASCVDAGFDRSYPTLVRELRRLELRPVCLVCQHRRGGAPTVEIEHPAGEEIQWDWLELPDTPWSEPAYVLVGALSHSGRFRAVFCEQMTFGHLAEALRTRSSWRWAGRAGCGGLTGWRRSSCPGTDRLTAVMRRTSPSTTASRSRSARRGAAQRKGVVEKAIQYLTGRGGAPPASRTPAQAQASVERWKRRQLDRRPAGRDDGRGDRRHGAAARRCRRSPTPR